MAHVLAENNRDITSEVCLSEAVLKRVGIEI